MCGLVGIENLRPDTSQRKSPLAKLFATVGLWKDVRIWLLAPTNVTFGFSAAYLNGYFNATYEGPDLGVKALGILTAVTVGGAAILSKVYGKIGQTMGKGTVICIGAVSFAGIPLLVLTTDCCESFGWFIVIFYILQGSGRAVYESTNKAVFSDFFTGDSTEGAFANCSMQMSIASAVLFFNSGKFSGHTLAYMVMASALVTPLTFAAASMTKGGLSSPREEDEPIMANKA
jgi:MFS family permease